MPAETITANEYDTGLQARDLALEYALLLQEDEDWPHRRGTDRVLGWGTALLVSAGGWWVVIMAVARRLW